MIELIPLLFRALLLVVEIACHLLAHVLALVLIFALFLACWQAAKFVLVWLASKVTL